MNAWGVTTRTGGLSLSPVNANVAPLAMMVRSVAGQFAFGLMLRRRLFGGGHHGAVDAGGEHQLGLVLPFLFQLLFQRLQPLLDFGQFLGGLVVATTIPLAMLFAVTVMSASRVSGNLMSLGAIDFGLIVPCGLHGRGVTSFAKLLGRDVSLEEVENRLIAHAAYVLNRRTFPADATALPAVGQITELAG